VIHIDSKPPFCVHSVYTAIVMLKIYAANFPSFLTLGTCILFFVLFVMYSSHLRRIATILNLDV